MATLTISETSITGTGGGIEIADGGNLDVSFDSLSASSGAYEGIQLVGVTGSFSVTDGAINNTGVPAVDITSASSLALNVTLESVSVDGGTFGIRLKDTTGSFTVTGAGSDCSPTIPTCAGGRIQNMTGFDGAVEGNGIHLSNVAGISLSEMRLNDHTNQAILGFRVEGFSLVNSFLHGINGSDNPIFSESSLYLGDLEGTANIQGCDISGGYEHNITIVQVNVTLDRLIFTNNKIGHPQTANGRVGLYLRAVNTGVLNATVENSTFTGARFYPIEIISLQNSGGDWVISNNNITNSFPNPNSNAEGIRLRGSNGSVATYNISGNTILDSRDDGVFVGLSLSGVTGNWQGIIEGNTIGDPGIPDSGSENGNGILVTVADTGIHTTQVSGNKIYSFQDHGMEFRTEQGSSSLNATVLNNTVGSPSIGSLNALRVTAGENSGDSSFICADILDNAISLAGGLINDFNLVQNDSTTINLPSYGGGPTDTAAVVTFVQNNNPIAPVGLALASGLGGGYTGIGTECPLPVIPMVQNHDQPTIEKQQEFYASAKELEPGIGAVEETRNGTMAGSGNPSAPQGGPPSIILDTLNQGQMVAFSFEVTVNDPVPPGTTMVCSQGSISGTNFPGIFTDDPDTGAASDPTCMPIDPPEADLSISKTDSPDPVNVGNALTYTVTVNNAGPDEAVNVVVTDTLPAGVTFVSTAGCAEDPIGVPTCSLGNIASGGSAMYTITVTPDPGTLGTITNIASVSSDTDDPDGKNNFTSEDTDVVADADLSITKTDSVDPVIAGNQLTYTITVDNAGPGVADNVVVTDTLPAGVSLVSTSGCAEDPAAVPTCSLGSIASGANAVYTVTVTVDNDYTDGGMLTNMATVASSTNDPDGNNNSTTEDTMVDRSSDLSITKRDLFDPAIAGEELTYIINYENLGPSDADNVVITDTLPVGMSYVSDTAGCVEAPVGTLTCSLASAPNGFFGNLNVVVLVDSSVAHGAMLSNTASIASDSMDPTPGNSSATEPTEVIREVDIDLTSTESIDPVVAGSGPDNLVHTFTVTNNGPSDASGVDIATVSGTPPDVTFTSVTSGSTIVGGNGWLVGDLPSGAIETYTLTYTVPASIPVGTDTIQLSMSVFSVNETDTDAGNDDSEQLTSVERQIDLIVTMTDDPDPVVAGFELGGLTYEVTVTNDGPSDGDAIVINDPIAALPTGIEVFEVFTSAGVYDETDWIVDLPAGEAETLTLTLTVGPDTVPGDNAISNTAMVTGSGGGEIIINTGDDSATELTTVLPTTASWTVSKDFLDDSGASVTATITCTSGEVTGPEQVSEGGDVTLTVERFLMGPFGTTDCEITESNLPADYFQVSASEDCEVDGIVHEDEFGCDFVNAPIRANFTVTKDFSDDNPADVRVVIECNTGLPLMQESMLSEFGNPFDSINFIVQNYEVGTLNCDIYESPVPAGYEDGYNASADPDDTLPAEIISGADGCSYEGISTGSYGCEIDNQLQPVDVTVNKVWIDENQGFNNPTLVEITFSCNAEIFGVCPDSTEGCRYQGDDIWVTERYIDPDNPAEFLVLPHWDGSTVCSATEEPEAGVIQDQDDCAAIPLAPGVDGSCTITNTRFYEGIPTLSQYGLMLLSLLMLGMGAVAFRRYV